MPSWIEIPVKGLGPTKVDADQAELLRSKKLTWMGPRYVGFYDHQHRTYLHRWILQAQSGQYVDHINGDVLDNRRNNLRLASISINGLNRHALPRGVSGFRHVYLDRRQQSWRVNVTAKTFHYDGYFASRIVAVLVADAVIMIRRVEVPGYLNFPSSIRRADLAALIRSTKGKIFSVVFSRRTDGLERCMTCRMYVHKDLRGSGLLFDSGEKNLVSVYDMGQKQYRFIPLEGVLCLTFEKKRYAVVG